MADEGFEYQVKEVSPNIYNVFIDGRQITDEGVSLFKGMAENMAMLLNRESAGFRQRIIELEAEKAQTEQHLEKLRFMKSRKVIDILLSLDIYEEAMQICLESENLEAYSVLKGYWDEVAQLSPNTPENTPSE